MKFHVNPFTINSDLIAFITWCGGDPEGMSFDEAIEWSIEMEEWGEILQRAYPTLQPATQ